MIPSRDSSEVPTIYLQIEYNFLKVEECFRSAFQLLFCFLSCLDSHAQNWVLVSILFCFLQLYTTF